MQEILFSTAGFLIGMGLLYILSFLFWRSEHEFWGSVCIIGAIVLSYYHDVFTIENLKLLLIAIPSYIGIGLLIALFKWGRYTKTKAVQFKKLLMESMSTYENDRNLPPKSVAISDTHFVVYFLSTFPDLQRMHYPDAFRTLLDFVYYRAKESKSTTEIAQLLFDNHGNVFEYFQKVATPVAQQQFGKITCWITYWPLTFIGDYIIDYIIINGIRNIINMFGGVFSRVAASNFKLD